MTVESTTRKNTYTGNGATDTYAYGFKIYAATDLLVKRTDTLGNVTTLVYATDYTVANVGNAAGGTITLSSVLPASYTLSIERVVPYKQTGDFRNAGGYYPESVEDALDRTVMMIQQIVDSISTINNVLNPRGAWVTTTTYQVRDVVTQGGATYICAVAHVAGTFATDLAAGKWILIDAGNFKLTVGDGTASVCGRNRIINGDMRIDQRNAGAVATINAANSTYTIDRWYGFGQAADGVFTIQRLTATPPAGFSHYLRATVSTADASIGAAQAYFIAQPIEGVNAVDFGFGGASALSITVSFWVRSSLTGTFSGALRNGANNRSYPFTITISSANTWEFKTVTIAGDTTGTWVTDNTTWATLTFDLGCGSSLRGTAGAWAAANNIGVTGAVSLISTLSATFDLTGVQLEAGVQGTPFERRPYATEMALCQRYYFAIRDNGKYFGIAQSYGAAAALLILPHPVPMRTVPTGFSGNSGLFACLSAGGADQAATLTYTSGCENFSRIELATSGLVAGNATAVHMNGVAVIGITAEL